jgi:hypothetical protein
MLLALELLRGTQVRVTSVMLYAFIVGAVVAQVAFGLLLTGLSPLSASLLLLVLFLSAGQPHLANPAGSRHPPRLAGVRPRRPHRPAHRSALLALDHRRHELGSSHAHARTHLGMSTSHLERRTPKHTQRIISKKVGGRDFRSLRRFVQNGLTVHKTSEVFPSLKKVGGRDFRSLRRFVQNGLTVHKTSEVFPSLKKVGGRDFRSLRRFVQTGSQSIRLRKSSQFIEYGTTQPITDRLPEH